MLQGNISFLFEQVVQLGDIMLYIGFIWIFCEVGAQYNQTIFCCCFIRKQYVFKMFYLNRLLCRETTYSFGNLTQTRKIVINSWLRLARSGLFITGSLIGFMGVSSTRLFSTKYIRNQSYITRLFTEIDRGNDNQSALTRQQVSIHWYTNADCIFNLKSGIRDEDNEPNGFVVYWPALKSYRGAPLSYALIYHAI